MLDADAGGHHHRWMRHHDVFHINRANPLAAGLNHVLAAIGDLHEAVGVYRCHIAGAEIAVAIENLTAVALEVFLHNPRAAHEQIP